VAENTVKVRMELEGGVTVRPGDKLIARVAHPTLAALDQVDAWRIEMQQLLPGVDVLLVHGIDQLLVYRPDNDTERKIDGSAVAVADILAEHAAKPLDLLRLGVRELPHAAEIAAEALWGASIKFDGDEERVDGRLAQHGLYAKPGEDDTLGERLAANHATVTAELADALAQQEAERLVALTTYTISLDGYGTARIAYNGQGWTFSCDRCEVSGVAIPTAGEAEATARYHLKQEHTEEDGGG
jgi:hypothetical protein